MGARTASIINPIPYRSKPRRIAPNQQSARVLNQNARSVGNSGQPKGKRSNFLIGKASDCQASHFCLPFAP
jgi:hypothetical protein